MNLDYSSARKMVKSALRVMLNKLQQLLGSIGSGPLPKCSEKGSPSLPELGETKEEALATHRILC